MASVEIKTPPEIPGNTWEVRVVWKGDNSYANGGEPLSLKEIGFGPEAVFAHAITTYVKPVTEQAVLRPTTASYDGTKVHLYDAATGKEIASGADMSKVEVGFVVVCTSR